MGFRLCVQEELKGTGFFSLSYLQRNVCYRAAHQNGPNYCPCLLPTEVRIFFLLTIGIVCHFKKETKLYVYILCQLGMFSMSTVKISNWETLRNE
jgi:hypothetical protein